MKKLVRFDWAIKKLLRQKANFGILEGFLSELLHRDVRIKQILESESNKEHLKDKFNRVDLLAELDKTELVIIEIQNNREGDYFQRMLYGTAKVLTEHISEGDDYTVLKKVISVNIVYFDLGQGQDYIYHGTTRFIGLHKNDELALSEKQKETMNFKSIDDIYPEYYVLKVNEFNDVAKDTLDEWVYFLKNAEIKRGFSAKGLKQAQEKLAFMQMSESQQRNYRAYLENLRDDASYALTVKMDMEEMLEKATKEATDKAMKQGMQQGIERGMQQGMQQKSLEIAKTALQNGTTIDFVMSITGLSRTEVEAIASQG